MSLVLDGSTQAAERNNSDIANLLLVGYTLVMWVKPDALPSSGNFSDLFTFDRDESIAQMVALRLKEDGELRTQWVTASADDPNQTKDTTGTVPVDEWTEIRFKIVSNNGGNNYTVEVTIDGNTEQLSPTGTTGFRADLCSYFSLGCAITSGGTRHSFFSGKLAEVEIYDDEENQVHYWDFDSDANDKVGSAHLTLIGNPSFDADHPGGGGGEVVNAVVEARTDSAASVTPTVTRRPLVEARSDSAASVAAQTTRRPLVEARTDSAASMTAQITRRPLVEARTNSAASIVPQTTRRPTVEARTDSAASVEASVRRSPEVVARTDSAARVTPRVTRRPRVEARTDSAASVQATMAGSLQAQIRARTDSAARVTPTVRRAPRLEARTDSAAEVGANVRRRPTIGALVTSAARIEATVRRGPRILARTDSAARVTPRVTRRPRVEARTDSAARITISSAIVFVEGATMVHVPAVSRVATVPRARRRGAVSESNRVATIA